MIIIISISIFILVILGVIYQYIKFYKNEYLKCPKCGHKFKPPVLKMVFSINFIDGKYIKCPNCNSKEYCEIVKTTVLCQVVLVEPKTNDK